MTPNPARGEVALVLGGVPRRLCLTLGALAEIEAALGASNLAALAERLKSPSARDLLVILGALLKGGGEDEAARDLPKTEVDLEASATAVADAFARAFA